MAWGPAWTDGRRDISALIDVVANGVVTPMCPRVPLHACCLLDYSEICPSQRAAAFRPERAASGWVGHMMTGDHRVLAPLLRSGPGARGVEQCSALIKGKLL